MKMERSRDQQLLHPNALNLTMAPIDDYDSEYDTTTSSNIVNKSKRLSFFRNSFRTVEDILRMHANSKEMAFVYVSIILTCYLFGLVLLLLHHVKHKYGQITLYDIYLELAPASWTRNMAGSISTTGTGSSVLVTNTSSISRDVEQVQ